MTEVLEIAAFALLGVAAMLCVGRVARDGSLPDKVLGADTLVLVLVAGVATAAGVSEETTFLDVLLVVTLLGFIATITVARFVERRGGEELSVDVAGAILTLVGALFVLVAAVGLHRFDDVFARTHAAGKATTFGLGLILLGAALRLGDAGSVARLALAGILALVTIPAGAHVIGRAAFRSGTELSERTVLDDASARRFESPRDT